MEDKHSQWLLQLEPVQREEPPQLWQRARPRVHCQLCGLRNRSLWWGTEGDWYERLQPHGVYCIRRVRLVWSSCFAAIIYTLREYRVQFFIAEVRSLKWSKWNDSGGYFLDLEDQEGKEITEFLIRIPVIP